MKKIALCFAGGGAGGVLQVGMAKACQDLNVNPDFVFGASVGSLNACLFVQNEVNRAEELWLNISNNKVYNFHPWILPQLLINRNYVYDSSPLRELIEEYIDYEKLVNSPIPLRIAVTNITDWTAETYSPQEVSEEDWKTLLHCSASPPLLFEPIRWRDKLYSDGGIINNYLCGNAVSTGADVIIILSPTMRNKTDVKDAIDVLQLLTSLPEYCYLDRELSFIDKINKIQEPFPHLREIKHILVRPAEPTGIKLLNFDFEDKEFWIQEGYNLCSSILSKELQ